MESGSVTTFQPPSLSSTSTIHAIVSLPQQTISKARKYVLLLLFSVAQFIDVCNISSLFSAVPTIAEELHMSPSQSVWLISGYQLTFASFLLLVRYFSLP
jgi:predicted MFS family arabinose efflux permease